MCGIAGILQYAPTSSDLEAALLRMQQAIRHRGPDDEGIFLHGQPGSHRPPGSQTHCGLAHTRLSILDLSPCGHQPMATPDGRYWISFNGEIYNFRELRLQLLAEGVKFQSESDTEVLLHLYQKDGARCVDQLVGMFVFAIWDVQEEKLFLARDPLGIKPVYYFQAGGKLLFASELRAVLASGWVPRELCLPSLHHYLMTGSVPAPLSMIKDVRILPAGHSLTWRRGEVDIQEYWQIQFRPDQENVPIAPALVRAGLLDSVRRHFVSDVPVGIFLSGGIDSTVLLALAQQMDFSEIKTFCISFDDPKFNEGEISGRTAEYFGATHLDWRLNARTGASLLEEFLSRIDQPTIDGFNTFCVSKHAHTHGVKAILSGLGGDELFGGYQSFRDIPRLYQWGRRLEKTGPLGKTAGRWMEASHARAPIRRLGSYLQGPATMAAAYRTYRGIYTAADASRLARHYTGCDVPPNILANQGAFDGPQDCLEDQVSRFEIENYMRFQLLRDSDVMSMAWGLELRVPFVDRRLVESVTTIPAAQRLAPGKRMLLQAVPEIPSWVAHRRKQGFSFPFEGWLADEWKPIFQTIGAGSGVQVQTWYQKWSLFVLERWCKSVQVALPALNL